MTTDENRARLTRIADARMARRLDDDATASAPASPPANTGRWPVAGDRVFDTVSGEEGTIRNVDATTNTRVPIVRIQFADGRVEPRFADLVVVRPVPPAARV